MDLPLPDETVAALNQRFERSEPHAVLRWALDGVDRVAIASAFQADGTVLLDMAVRMRRDVPVLFLNTGFHFEETLAYKRELTERLGLTVVDLRGEHTPETQAAAYGERLYERAPDECCRLNKVEPFSHALHDYDAWLTALRRDSAPTRAGTPILEQYDLEPGRPMLKVNPLAAWSRQQVWSYLEEHDLPHHPLYELGYAQIGCAPCTRLVLSGEDERAGRWDGTQKVECGLHLREPGSAGASQA